MNSEDISASDDNKKSNPARFIAREILNGLETLIQEAQANTRPLEVDPYRSRMFEFFVTADGAGLIKDDREVAAFEDLDEDSDEMDLSADYSHVAGDWIWPRGKLRLCRLACPPINWNA
jgi:hypothetical protein